MGERKFTFSWVANSPAQIRKLPSIFRFWIIGCQDHFYRRAAHPAPLQLYLTLLPASFLLLKPLSLQRFTVRLRAPLVFLFGSFINFSILSTATASFAKFTISCGLFGEQRRLRKCGGVETRKRSPIDRRNRQTDAVNRDRSLLNDRRRSIPLCPAPRLPTPRFLPASYPRRLQHRRWPLTMCPTKRPSRCKRSRALLCRF